MLGKPITCLALLFLGGTLAGCAVEFGLGTPDGGGGATDVRERNLLYQKEQERLERMRQTFEPIRPSER